MNDTDRLKKILERLYWDGYGFWLPELCVKETLDGFEAPPIPASFDEFRKFLDNLE